MSEQCEHSWQIYEKGDTFHMHAAMGIPEHWGKRPDIFFCTKCLEQKKVGGYSGLENWTEEEIAQWREESWRDAKMLIFILIVGFLSVGLYAFIQS